MGSGWAAPLGEAAQFTIRARVTGQIDVESLTGPSGAFDLRAALAAYGDPTVQLPFPNAAVANIPTAWDTNYLVTTGHMGIRLGTPNKKSLSTDDYW